jgi:hypothetical protein
MGFEMDVFHMCIYIYILKSVDVYIGYVVTEPEGNKNIGQYYS